MVDGARHPAPARAGPRGLGVRLTRPECGETALRPRPRNYLRPPLSLRLIARLEDDFSESDLPWRVDVVDWATTQPGFRRIIEQSKVVLDFKNAPAAAEGK
jgi:hypothetical protein